MSNLKKKLKKRKKKDTERYRPRQNRRTHYRRANSRTGERNAGALLLTDSPYWYSSSLLPTPPPPPSRSPVPFLSLSSFRSLASSGSRSRTRYPRRQHAIVHLYTFLTSSRYSSSDVNGDDDEFLDPVGVRMCDCGLCHYFMLIALLNVQIDLHFDTALRLFIRVNKIEYLGK